MGFDGGHPHRRRAGAAARRRRARRQGLLAVLGLVLVLTVPLAGGPAGPQAAAQEGAPAADAAAPADLRIQARSALLVDAVTGQELYAQDPDRRVLPASLAKIMTLDLVFHALEQGKIALDQEVTVSEAAWRLSVQAGIGGPSAMFLRVGERVRIEDLIRGVAVASGNDASLVLAEAVAGSEQAFVTMMNRHAAEIGLQASRFSNSHGLPGGEQHVTARDMARLALHVLAAHPEILEYTSQKTFTWKDFAPQPNYNRLLFRDRRVDGLKTGHLAAAGFHVVATAKEGERRLVAVVLGAASDALRVREAQRLLDYGFQQFTNTRVAFGEEGRQMVPVYKGARPRVTVEPAAPPVVTVPKTEAGEVRTRVELRDPLVAPLAQGARVGTLTIEDARGRVLRTVPLVTAEAVPRGGLFRVFWDSVRLLFRDLFA
ncbi:D-alanyl-D-alanine carboxypeptidase family protein [Thermaerobacter composti]|uniref:serine-type D-Ala-D-Ala carboxypeptidase n=1 Tax=Thermaerobacter composti TaxID=554949 RepID=A0ABZ0QRL6_9FIRM|nr:D-alanyl-D-alanine carboxypeptidase family protein [Thermaerobacter composti]WPD20031.1 D-alanyl-D-alanine carboxypeptidase family protein [Thermaerobacter composti]